MKLFIIAGKAKCGKTTFGNYLREELKEYGYKPCVMQITGPLYGYAEDYFDWDPNSDEKPREFLQKMGTDIIKEKLGKKTFLLDRLSEDIDILSEFFDTFIITDARYPEEITYFKEKFDKVCTIKLLRNDYEDNLTDSERNHITEVAMDEYDDFDYILENDGLDSLKNTAHILVKSEEEAEGLE
ncbi:MAG: hypothetical protein IJ193_03545 [Bacilli bacterium]|nr:hypothetical protein [Bacilli bacterium]